MAEKEDEKYDVLEKIGQGSFGIIRKVRQKHTNRILCRKEISYSRMSDKEKNQLHAELRILESLRHPNIVQYVHREHLKSSHDLHLYMEYCGNGDLGGYVKKLKDKGQYADEGFIWGVFAQLISALYRCHYGEDPPRLGDEGKVSKGRLPYQTKEGYRVILHRDLKPENVFLGDNNSVKLGDFGLSKIIASHDFASTYVGTPFYMSPEICAAERYSHHSDIWSLGCIMYELASRCVPFDARNHVELIMKIKAGRIKPLPSHYSRELGDVIGSCLKVDPRSRPDCAQLLNVPNIKLARTRLEVQDLVPVQQERDLALNKLARAQKEIQELQGEVHRLKEQGKKVEMEWHAKATLAIDQRVHEQVEIKKAELLKQFDAAVEQRAEEKLGLHLASLPANHGLDNPESQHVRSSTPPPDRAASFTTTNGTRRTRGSSVHEIADDSALETDLTSLSIQEDEPVEDVSPLAQRHRVPKKLNRQPLGRAKTYATANFETNLGSPVDVQMADPSPMPSHVAPPMSIKGLSLSPRKNAQDRLGGGAGLRRNIFQKHGPEHQLRPRLSGDNNIDGSFEGGFADDLDDDDDVNPLPDSPSRPNSGLSNNSNNDPFKTLADPPTRPKALPRPSLARQQTMPVNFPQNDQPQHHQQQPRAAAQQTKRQNVFRAARAPGSPEKEKENRPPSTSNTSNSTSNSRNSKPASKSAPKEIPHVSAASPKRPARSQPSSNPAADPSKVLTPNRKAPPAPPSSNVAAKANRPAPQQKTPAKKVQGRTLVELSSQGGGAGAQVPVLVPTGFESGGKASPAKWDPVVEGEGMPSPFLCKGKGVGAVR